jgi:ubiquinone/menaquinone biosynthesis C-methylase UbiE
VGESSRARDDAGSGDPTELGRVARLWDETVRKRVATPIQGWLDSPIVLEAHVQPRIAGDPLRNWLIGLAARLPIPAGGRWLSLGCGAAGLEIHAVQQGLCASMRAVDVSQASIEEAQRAAAAAAISGIEFTVDDFNVIELPTAAFDVVLMNMSLHHVRELSHILGQISSTLTPSGLLVLNEYIGPGQFQFAERQLSIVKDLLDVLDPPWRIDLTTGQVKSEYVARPVEFWNQADPSEAIRSDRIVAEVEQQFEIVERCDYGGTILHLLLEHIVHNFDRQDGKDVSVIRLLARFEDLLIRFGVLTSDFAVLVARRKGGPPLEAAADMVRSGTGAAGRAERIRQLEQALTSAQGRLDAIERSRVWRLAQRLRRLVGREW